MIHQTVAGNLGRKRRITRLVLWTERVVPAIAPATAILLCFIAAAALGLVASLPYPLGTACLATITIAAALAVRSLTKISAPTQADIDTRLEHRDPHRPLATLADRPALPGSDELWQAHCEHARARIPALRAGVPKIRRSSSLALTVLAILAITCVLRAGPLASPRLWAALIPIRSDAPPQSTELQAWITNPPRMGLPPLFLHATDTAPLHIPLGAQLTVSVLGSTRAPSLVIDQQPTPFRRLDRANFQAALTLTQNHVLQIRQAGTQLARWQLLVAADNPPTIQITATPTRAGRQLVLPWRATDDYGLAKVSAELRRADRPSDPPVTITLPLTGFPRTAEGARLPDLTAHPWAGLPLLLRYIAQDNAGQGNAGHRATSAEVAVSLPERTFTNPLARTLIATRRGLVLHPDARTDAAAGLDGLAPLLLGQLSPSQWLNLRAIAAALYAPTGTPAEPIARLWQLAVQIEDGGVTDARQRLTQAERALSDALTAPATDTSNIEALTQALQHAMQNYLAALARQAARAGDLPPSQASDRTIDAAQLRQMEQQLAASAHAGRLADAQQQLQRLTELLDNLRAGGRPDPSTGAQAQDPAVEQLLHDQAALQNRATTRLSPASPASPDPAAQRRDDGKAQTVLRQQLGALASKLGDRTGQVPGGLAQADAAMHDAQTALGQGNDKTASAAQQRALDGLRQAGQSQSGPSPGAPPGPGTDPLGRPLADNGTNPDNSDIALPGGTDSAATRALRDELRRRGADRTRPQAELDYIDRLLQSP